MQTSKLQPLILIALLLVSGLGGSFIGSFYTERRLKSYYNPIIAARDEELASYEETVNQLSISNVELREDIKNLEEYLEYYEGLSERLEKLENSPDPVTIFDPVLTNGFDYIPTHLSYEAKASQYSLPLNLGNVKNFNEVNSKLKLSDQAKKMLRNNGFVVLENSLIEEEEYVKSFYGELKGLDVPIFITSDSLLHMYHIQFDETLKNIEQKIFFNDIWNISLALYTHSIAQLDSTEGKLHEAHRRNAEYFAVALCLLKPDLDQISEPPGRHELPDEGAFLEEDLEKYSFTLDPRIKETVEKELELIKAGSGFVESNIFIYEEDYSQYFPRGHYTRSEKLRNYFKVFMWYGRMGLLLKGDSDIPHGETCNLFTQCDSLISEYDAEIQTMQACLITGYLQQWYKLWQKWNRIYDITSFYVGLSDDLGPIEYLEALNTVFSGEYSPKEISTEKVNELKQKLMEYPKPKIYGGTGNIVLIPPITPEQLDTALEASTGFRLMGQRSVPDSVIFQELVIPRVHAPLGTGEPFTLVHTPAGPTRGFPRGLDVMGILGSQRAVEILDELKDSNYENYQEQFDMLAEEYENYRDGEWNRNLYWSWLFTLKPLLKEHASGYPTFMRTQAWQDKQLTTALASWTELRHDTILYVKQSYSMVPSSGIIRLKPIQGYVEPVPEFWARLLDLTRMTRRGLDSYGVLDEESKYRLQSLENIITRLLDVSKKELINEPLSENDYNFIEDFGNHLDDVVGLLEKDSKRVTLVADVHTDSNSLQVLEEGIGYLRLMVVAYKLPDGRIAMGAGPVLSYYEFKHPMADRLTDEAWRDLLNESPPENPEWIHSFTATN